MASKTLLLDCGCIIRVQYNFSTRNPEMELLLEL